METYFTADEHHLHKNIINFCDRPYDSKEEMTEALVENHNNVVKDGDKVWHLGDFSYRGDWHDVQSILRRLNGNHEFIFGNHDSSLMRIANMGRSHDMIRSGKLKFHGPAEKGKSLSMMVQVNGQQIQIAHYAQRTWLGAFRGAIMLYGHSHCNLPELKGVRSFDVGVDAWNYAPVPFDVIKEKADLIDAGESLSQTVNEGVFEDGSSCYSGEIKRNNQRIRDKVTDRCAL